MNPIFPDPASRHDDEVSRARALHVGRLVVDNRRHDSKSGHKDETFTHIAFVEKNLAEGCGDTALVPTVFDPFNDAVEEPSRVEMRFQFSLIIPRPHAKAVSPQNQF